MTTEASPAGPPEHPHRVPGMASRPAEAGPAVAITLDVLHGIVGEKHARQGEPADAVDGVQPRFVAAPGSIEEASRLMVLASHHGLAVTPRGSGTKMGWGNPPQRVDLVVETQRLNKVLEHAAGDLVVIAQAGIEIAALQEVVGQSGQMLAIDSSYPNATVGGIIAANAAGPHRLRFGTMKDLLIGITIVLPDGTVAKSGGKVVKNVAGYDLGKLFTGSLGTLGLIVETIFRLHALPAARRVLVIEVGTPGALGDALQALMHSSLVPSALDLQWDTGSGRLIAVFEGVEPGVIAQAETAAGLAAPFGPVRVLSRVLGSDEAAPLWEDMLRPAWTTEDILLKIGTLPAELPGVLAAVDDLTHRHNVRARITGHAAVTVLSVALSGTEQAVIDLVRDLRQRVMERAGNLVIVQAPVAVKRAADVWGAAGDALPVMQRIKQQFDPQGIMNPGRYVGGI